MMKIVAVICNLVLFAFTCVVLATEGPPQAVSYWVFTVWALLTMILSAVVIFRIGETAGWLKVQPKSKAVMERPKVDEGASANTILRIVTIVANIVFFGFVCWAIVDQYPHPEEDGVLAFTVLMALTPLLSLVAVFRGGVGDGWLALHLKSKA